MCLWREFVFFLLCRASLSKWTFPEINLKWLFLVGFLYAHTHHTLISGRAKTVGIFEKAVIAVQTYNYFYWRLVVVLFASAFFLLSSSVCFLPHRTQRVDSALNTHRHTHTKYVFTLKRKSVGGGVCGVASVWWIYSGIWIFYLHILRLSLFI